MKRIFLLLLSVFCLFCIFLCFLNVRVFLQRREFKKQQEVLQAKILNLIKEKEQLEASTNEAGRFNYLERTAREELNFKKEGETVVAFPKIDSTSTDSFEDGGVFQWILNKVK